MRFLDARSRTNSGRSGFTLIELLVVIALLGLVGLIALPNISGVFKISLSSSVRELASTIKETYNTTMMTKRVHRLVIDIKANQFWVEMGPTQFLMDTEDSKRREERLTRGMSFKEREEAEKKKSESFVIIKGINKGKRPLPRGVSFEDVITEQNDQAIVEGQAYIHFFPGGMIEQSMIHLQDNSSHKATLVVQPIVGRTRVYDRHIPKEEVFSQK